jgi:hypothetical protein
MDDLEALRASMPSDPALRPELTLSDAMVPRAGQFVRPPPAPEPPPPARAPLALQMGAGLHALASWPLRPRPALAYAPGPSDAHDELPESAVNEAVYGLASGYEADDEAERAVYGLDYPKNHDDEDDAASAPPDFEALERDLDGFPVQLLAVGPEPEDTLGDSGEVLEVEAARVEAVRQLREVPVPEPPPAVPARASVNGVTFGLSAGDLERMFAEDFGPDRA